MKCGRGGGGGGAGGGYAVFFQKRKRAIKIKKTKVFFYQDARLYQEAGDTYGCWIFNFSFFHFLFVWLIRFLFILSEGVSTRKLRNVNF